jgi:hypothetical protein
LKKAAGATRAAFFEEFSCARRQAECESFSFWQDEACNECEVWLRFVAALARVSLKRSGSITEQRLIHAFVAARARVSLKRSGSRYQYQ